MNLNTILLVMVLLVLAFGAGAVFGFLGVILAILGGLWLLLAGLDRIAAWYHRRPKRASSAPLPVLQPPRPEPPPSLIHIVDASPVVAPSHGDRVMALVICLFYGAILALVVLS